MAVTTLATVQNYITDIRTLLQDTVAEYRYDDASLLVALNLAFMDGRRLRADLFLHDCWCGPSFSTFTAVDSTTVHMEYQFREAFVHGACAHATARDQEDIQDAKSNAFMATYNAILVGTTRPGMVTPPAKQGGKP